jgi:hypothetical protein
MSKLLLSFMFCAALACAGNITYTLNDPIGPGGVTGDIVTDGTIGPIFDANIVDFNLLLSDGTNTFDLTGPLSGNNAVFAMEGGIVASATQLTYNFSGLTIDFFENPTIGSGINYLCFVGGTGGCTFENGEAVSITGLVVQTVSLSGTHVIATAGSSGVPEPSTFALLALGAVALITLKRAA